MSTCNRIVGWYVLAVDVVAGTFRNETTGEARQVAPPDPFLQDMLRAGGLIALARTRQQLFAGADLSVR